MLEDKLQATITQYFWNTYPERRGLLFHVNQKAKNAIEGARMKAMGVVAGVSDLVLIKTGAVLFIELKTDTGTQSAPQKEFERKVTAAGHTYVIVKSLDDFIKLL